MMKRFLFLSLFLVVGYIDTEATPRGEDNFPRQLQDTYGNPYYYPRPGGTYSGPSGNAGMWRNHLGTGYQRYPGYGQTGPPAYMGGQPINVLPRGFYVSSNVGTGQAAGNILLPPPSSSLPPGEVLLPYHDTFSNGFPDARPNDQGSAFYHPLNDPLKYRGQDPTYKLFNPFQPNSHGSPLRASAKSIESVLKKLTFFQPGLSAVAAKAVSVDKQNYLVPFLSSSSVSGSSMPIPKKLTFSSKLDNDSSGIVAKPRQTDLPPFAKKLATIGVSSLPAASSATLPVLAARGVDSVAMGEVPFLSILPFSVPFLTPWRQALPVAAPGFLPNTLLTPPPLWIGDVWFSIQRLLSDVSTASGVLNTVANSIGNHLESTVAQQLANPG
eukprot:GHVS01040124.1.p1 GENE.GHVS01040124.1~~GHVS01040124.1.p1  ORF type:complete len:383 (-),score=28.11 GHVS01040124.1:1734-2882(-)